MTKEKKERTLGQQFMRVVWIGLGAVVGIPLLIAVISFLSGPSDQEDLTDNQQYVITVQHQGTTDTYYCSGYKKNLVNNSYILVDYEGTPFFEIFYSPEFYMTVSLNPKYKKEYFQKKLNEKVSEDNLGKQI